MLRSLASPLALIVTLTCLSACSPRTSSEPAASAAPVGTAVAVPPPPGDFDASRALQAGFLIVDGVYNSELMAPYDILHHSPFHTAPAPGIEVFTVSPDGQAITTYEGLVIQPHYGFDDAPPIDVLVVPSAEHSMDTDLEDERLIGWVRETGAKASFVLSLCDGAFVLAQAGLLDGRAVTTFPGDQDRFAETFPHLDLRRQVTMVHDGRSLTSVGGARSYTPALYLIAHLYGQDVAKRVSGGLVLDWPPTYDDLPIEIVGADQGS